MALAGTYENASHGEASTYQEWKDCHAPESLPGTDWKSKYRLYFGSANRFENAAESDYDPYDRWCAEQGRFLRT